MDVAFQLVPDVRSIGSDREKTYRDHVDTSIRPGRSEWVQAQYKIRKGRAVPTGASPAVTGTHRCFLQEHLR